MRSLAGFLGATFLSLVFVGIGLGEPSQKLNVLLIISDDLRCELGCYGSKLAKTPNLDRLAGAGVRFDRAYCQFPLCNPSRSSMLTGRYPTTTGILGNRSWFGTALPEFVSLPRYFKDNGYATLRSGKIFHGGIDDTDAWTEGGERRRYGLADGLPGTPPVQANNESDEFPSRESRLTKDQRSDRWIVLPGNGEAAGDFHRADRAIALLRQYRNQPFFLGVGFEKPHSPPEAPQRFYDLYELDQIPLPPDFAPRPTVPQGFPRGAIRRKNADLFIGRDASPLEARQMIRAYLASVSWMDWNVGRVIDELDRLGLREQTVIVFWGDHGYQLGEKGKWSKAGSLFEQTARVPLVIVAPQAKGNARASPRVVQSIDIYPTLCALCGLTPPTGLEGRNLTPLLADPTAPWNYPAYTIWSEDGRSVSGVAVRTERWRYAEFDGGRGGAMLLDPQADPHETANLADDPRYSSVRAGLSAVVRQHVSADR